MVMDMSIFDECDVEYSVGTEILDKNFYERGKDSPSNTWGLIVSRRLVASFRNVRILRKHGLISRKDMFQIFIRSPKVAVPVALITMLAAIASLPLMAVVSLWLFCVPLALGGAAGILAQISGTQQNFMKELIDKINKEFTKDNTGRVDFIWDDHDLYEFASSLSGSNGRDTKKKLFELVSKYPNEVIARINELHTMKEEIPKSAETSQIVLADMERTLKKLFDMRDTPETDHILSQVRKVLNDRIHRENMKDMGVSVEKMSKILDFVNKEEAKGKETQAIKSTADVSSVVDELNSVSDKPENAMVRITAGPFSTKAMRK